MGKRGGLNPRQESFCQEYVKDKNGTRAAERAGYTGNDVTLGSTASDLLKNPKVAARIAELLEALAKRNEVTADRVVKRLAGIAFADFSKAYDEHGVKLDWKRIPPNVRRAMAAGVEGSEQVAALKALLAHLKPPVQKHEHSGPGGRPIERRDVTNLSDEELEVLYQAELAKAWELAKAGERA